MSSTQTYSTCDRQVWEWTNSVTCTTATSKSFRFSSCKTSWRLHLSLSDLEPKLGLIGGAEKAEISCNLRIWFDDAPVDLNGVATKNVLETEPICVFHGSDIFVRNKYVLLEGLGQAMPTNVRIKLRLDITTINVETVVGIPQSTFSSDIESAIENNEEFQDTTLIVGQENSKEEIKANKFMLMARSPVFARMFQINTKEKSTNIVEIPDVSPKVFKTVLSYIYTGRVNDLLSLEETISMMNTAGKYNLEHLKALCENRLAILLNAMNAAHILVAADHLSCEKLKCEVLKFITKDIDLCGDNLL